MRVEVQDVDEFLTTLGREYAVEGFCGLFNDAIYVDVERSPLNGDKRTAISFSVNLQVTAIVAVDAENQYILQSGEVCGIDRKDDDEAELKSNGTATMQSLMKMLEHFAEMHKLRIMPGVISG